MRILVAGPIGRARTRWRSSLYLRVVATTLALSILVVLVLGQVLMGRITSGLLDAKQRASLVEAQAGLNKAQALITAAGEDSSEQRQSLEPVAVELARGGQGTPRLYDVLLLSSSTSLLQRGSSTVTEESVPDDLRSAVESEGVQASTFTEIVYSDGRPPVPGFAVGAPLTVPGLGTAELYYLLPLAQEQQTLDLVRRTLLFAGLVLIASRLRRLGPADGTARQLAQPRTGYVDAMARILARSNDLGDAAEPVRRAAIDGIARRSGEPLATDADMLAAQAARAGVPADEAAVLGDRVEQPESAIKAARALARVRR